MHLRQTAVLALIAALLGLYIYVVEIRGGRENAAADQAERLLFSDLDLAAIERLEVTTREGETAVVGRAEEGWRLRAPIDFAASGAVVEAITAAIGSVERDGSVKPGVDLTVFGLGDEGTRVAFEVGDRREAFVIGNPTPVGANRYVHVDGQADVDLVANHRLQPLAVSLDDLRDHRVLPFETSRVEHVRLAWPGVEVELERRGGDWLMTAPIESRGDAETLDTLLADIAYLRAEGFVDEVDEAGAPTIGDSATSAFSMHLGGDAMEPGGLQLEAGDARSTSDEGVDLILVKGRDGFVYEVAAERLDDWPRRVSAYRDKSVARFDAAAARGFELALASDNAVGVSVDPVRIRGELTGGTWTTGEEPMSRAAAARLISTLARLEGADIVAESVGEREAAGLGLAPPRVDIRVWGEDGGDASTPLAEVMIGRTIPGLGVIARAGAGGPIFALPESIAESMPTSLEAYRAHFAGFIEPDVDRESDGGAGTGDDPSAAAGFEPDEDPAEPEI